MTAGQVLSNAFDTVKTALRVSTASKVIELNPTMDTAAYSTGDRMGSIMTLTAAARAIGEGAVLTDISIIDTAKQALAFDIFFFDELPTIASADNAAISITAAEMKDKFIGKVSIAATDFSTSASVSEGQKSGINILMKPIAASKDLFAVCVARGSWDFVAATDLVLKFKFLQD